MFRQYAAAKLVDLAEGNRLETLGAFEPERESSRA
jgi:hypothetical protein